MTVVAEKRRDRKMRTPSDPRVLITSHIKESVEAEVEEVEEAREAVVEAKEVAMAMEDTRITMTIVISNILTSREMVNKEEVMAEVATKVATTTITIKITPEEVTNRETSNNIPEGATNRTTTAATTTIKINDQRAI